MAPPSVLTIILNYRTASLTLRSAAAARLAMRRLDGEIVIVDNDSQDGSLKTIGAHIQTEGWTDVRVISSGHNGGYGAGNNFGIRAGLSDGRAPDYIYVLNSDAFPDAHAIKALVAHLESHPRTGFAGSCILGEDGQPHVTTFRFPSLRGEFEGAANIGSISRALARHRMPIDTPDHSRPVDWLAGASLMMRRDVLDDIGLFDETFFLYFEETDLCKRAARAGYRVDFVIDSKVTHVGSASTGMTTWKRTPEYWYDSRFHYFDKNHGRFYAGLATLSILAGGFLFWLRCAVTTKKRSTTPEFLHRLARHHFKAFFGPKIATDLRQDKTAHSPSGE